MKIILAADGSKYTKKALAFLATHEALAGDDGEVIVLHVQVAVPPRVSAIVGSEPVRAFHQEEAEKVLAPVRKFLERRGIAHRTRWVVGSPADQILRAAHEEGAHMIAMGTHGYGLLGRALMGSVAQRVLAGADVPVLLVK